MENTTTPATFYVSYFSQAWKMTADNFRKLCLDQIHNGAFDGLGVYGQALSAERSEELIGNDDAICLVNFDGEDAAWYMDFHNWRWEA